VAQHGANGGSAADGEPSDAAYAVISAAAEAREHRAHAAADDDLFGGGQLEGSVQSGAVITVEPLVSTTATQQQAEDLFAAFSPTNAAKARTEFDDWGAEEGFGAFSTVAAGNNVAAELAAAGVAVSSPKRVTRDWCVPALQCIVVTWRLINAVLSAPLMFAIRNRKAACFVQSSVSPMSLQHCKSLRGDLANLPPMCCSHAQVGADRDGAVRRRRGRGRGGRLCRRLPGRCITAGRLDARFAWYLMQ